MGFLEDLITAMTQQDPADRPTASEALRQFREVKSRLDVYSIRRPLRRQDEGLLVAVIQNVFSFSKERGHRLVIFLRASFFPAVKFVYP